VVDFLAPSTLDGPGYEYRVTIQNTGTGEGYPDLAWQLFSTTQDFSSGYRYEPIHLTRIDGETNKLSPDETGVFKGGPDDWIYGSGMIQAAGDQYLRIWVNPDQGVFFETTEEKVMEEYDDLESDYTDNITPTAIVNVSDDYYENFLRKCVEDNFEENDSYDTVASIDLSTEYQVKLCFDNIDYFRVNLAEGTNYELNIKGTGFKTDLVVVNPDKTYLMKDRGFETDGIKPFKAPLTGAYWIAFYDNHLSGGTSKASFSISVIP
jgi:hypothetical protein